MNGFKNSINKNWQKKKPTLQFCDLILSPHGHTVWFGCQRRCSRCIHLMNVSVHNAHLFRNLIVDGRLRILIWTLFRFACYKNVLIENSAFVFFFSLFKITFCIIELIDGFVRLIYSKSAFFAYSVKRLFENMRHSLKRPRLVINRSIRLLGRCLFFAPFETIIGDNVQWSVDPFFLHRLYAILNGTCAQWLDL